MDSFLWALDGSGIPYCLPIPKSDIDYCSKNLSWIKRECRLEEVSFFRDCVNYDIFLKEHNLSLSGWVWQTSTFAQNLFSVRWPDMGSRDQWCCILMGGLLSLSSTSPCRTVWKSGVYKQELYYNLNLLQNCLFCSVGIQSLVFQRHWLRIVRDGQTRMVNQF